MANPTGSILLRRGPTTDRLSFVPLEGEIIYDTTLEKVFLGDSNTYGGVGIVQRDFPNPGVMIKGLSAENFTVAPGKDTDLDPAIQYLSYDRSAGQYVFTSISASGSALTSITLNGSTGLTVNRTDISPSVSNPTLVTTGTVTFALQAATTTNIGGVVIPAVATSGINNTNGTISLATSSYTQLGAVKIDNASITINGNGVISVVPATSLQLGAVIIPAVATSGINNTNGTISLASASSTQIGGVIVDNSTITSNAGTITANWPVQNTNGTNGPQSIAIGTSAASSGLGNYTIALGYRSGGASIQGDSSVAIGNTARSLGNDSIAIGHGAGATAIRGISIGFSAGANQTGTNSIAIGSNAGATQSASSIILNASGNQINDSGISGLFINPIRNDTSNVTNALFWNSSTNEITYGPALPTQNSSVNGYYLTTNGSTASWSAVTPAANGLLTLAVSGTGLSGSATFTANQSTNVSFTVTSNATNTNTASTIVARDSSGNFSAGTITANLSGNATGLSILSTVATLFENATVSSSAPASTANFDLSTQAVQYYTSNSTNSFVVNVRGNSSTTLNSILNVGQSVTFALLNTCSNSTHYVTGVSIDGVSQSVKWQGGSAPAAGNVSSIDIYTFNIIKTSATPTYTVLAGQTKFA